MQHEDGHCDECGCAPAFLWLTITGRELCESCAVAGLVTSVKLATKPQARDDGR